LSQKDKAVTRTAKKIMINTDIAKTILSDVEMEVLLNIVKKLENIHYFLEQKKVK
jgi:hypothetical protein